MVFPKRRYGLKFDLLSQRIRLYVNVAILTYLNLRRLLFTTKFAFLEFCKEFLY